MKQFEINHDTVDNIADANPTGIVKMFQGVLTLDIYFVKITIMVSYCGDCKSVPATSLWLILEKDIGTLYLDEMFSNSLYCQGKKKSVEFFLS